MRKYLLLLLCVIEVCKCGVISSESNESTNETDSSISKSGETETTTPVLEEETTIVTMQSPNEEAKLPVDLLSEDVLLDPNVVLARLSRRDLSFVNSKWMYQPYEYNRQGGRQQKNDRIKTYSDYDLHPLKRPKKFKVYPVFPGK